MRVNKQSMGRLAVQLLLNQVFQADGGCITSIFRPSLIERNSVMPACRKENAASTLDAEASASAESRVSGKWRGQGQIWG